jgi:hypothetical protein
MGGAWLQRVGMERDRGQGDFVTKELWDGKNIVSSIRGLKVQFLPLMRCVTLAKSLNLSGFLRCKMR